ncbi:hypothetical protein [Ralstonia phage RSP15]|uniref:hypothetical protein n=1 Tax=Ralstonia phage RSP15 TaxID=1785960 RepID=UPI00074D46F6|nr:hypothetical protein BH754_gp193 [Ralstonia phage RSP15]BAU40113.1 hypothetical protein [Ralstonia phage RSP15]
MTEMTAQEASKKIAELTDKAYDALREATEIAQKFDISFDFSPAYGMGGSYEPEEGRWRSSTAICNGY